MLPFLLQAIFRGSKNFLAVSLVSLIAFIVGYSLLRLVRASPNWVTRILGGLIIIGSIALCVSFLMPHSGLAGKTPGNFPRVGQAGSVSGVHSSDASGKLSGAPPNASLVSNNRRGVPNILRFLTSGSSSANMLGAISSIVVIYTTTQWTARQWYRQIKKRTTSFLIQQSRNFFIFVREQHQFFGWVVAAAAIAHMAFYLPNLASTQMYDKYEFTTGFIGIGILALMTILGCWVWVESSWRKRAMPKLVRNIHASLTIAFLFVLLLHM